MQCREFEQRLNELLDERGEPTADARLLAHAEICTPCQTVLAGQQLLLVGLRQSAPAPLAPGFARQVMADVDFSAAAVRPRPASKLILAAATLLTSAAAALLAVSLVWYARSGNPVVSGQGTPVAETPAKGGNPRARGSRGGTIAVARRDWAQPDWLVEAPRFPDHLRQSIDEFADAFPESVQRIGEVERLAPGIRPLRLSFALFWDTLFRALPGVLSEPAKADASPGQPPGRTTSAVADLLRLV